MEFERYLSLGPYDEVYAAKLVSSRTQCFVLATNNPELRVIKDSHDFLAHGHEQSILTVDSPDWDDYLFGSGSKDNTMIIWRLNEAKTEADRLEQDFVKKISLATGHTHSVTGLRFCHSPNNPFVVTVSVDTTLKIWSLSEVVKQYDADVTKLTAASTVIAHSKDINSVDVSQNDRLVLTASMDKTAKLWHIDKNSMQLSEAGTLDGHKRGIWCAKFSNKTQMVVTCSGDCTIKLFSLIDKICLKTLEGHSFAVLSALFVGHGETLVSVDGGGIIKLWNVKKGLCEKTAEWHSDKIWSIEPIADGDTFQSFLTTGADGQVNFWKDVTEAVIEKKARENTKRVADQQAMSNFLQQNRFLDALVLAIECLKILTKIFEDSTSCEQISVFLQQLNSSQLSTLLDYASQWNTNGRTSKVAQSFLNYVLRTIPPQELLKIPNIDSIVKALIPYTNRHYERLMNLKKNASHLEYTFSCMRLT